MYIYDVCVYIHTVYISQFQVVTCTSKLTITRCCIINHNFFIAFTTVVVYIKIIDVQVAPEVVVLKDLQCSVVWNM